jgi:AcrR family transcriptional regulator
VPLNGRRAQAARNDQRILDAARAVFTADPDAPIAAVAARANVGISALYRRYQGKDDLLRRLCLDGLRRYIAVAEHALADEGDPWSVFTRFMRDNLDAGAGSLSVRFAGSFSADDELRQAGRQAHDATQQVLDRARRVGAIRAGVEVGDISLLFEQLQSIHAGGEQRAAQLRHRYLTLILDGLHMQSPLALPGPAPTWAEISTRYG